MGLETGSFINDLVITNPVGSSDAKSQGDDHIRLIKELLKATLPNATRAVELRGLLGGQVSTELTIGTGAATPTQNLHTIDTQTDDPTDDLDTLVTTNIPDGGFLLVRPANGTRTVVVKHNAGGAGQIALTDDLDFTMDQVDKLLVLQRSGADWVEVDRDFGTDLLAARTFLGVLVASTTVAGLAEIATQAEVDTGVDATRYVTPATLVSAFGLPRSYLAGFGLSNGTDTVHDVDVTVGECRSDDNTENIVLGAAITKQIDASWVVGDNQGGFGSAQIDGVQTVTFTDNGASPDFVTIDAGTWSTTPSINDTLIVTNGTNAGSYTVTAATVTQIDVATGSFLADATSASEIRHVKINTWYDIFTIKRSDTDVEDVFFEEATIGVILPTNYDKKRRLGAVLTDASSNILAFVQYGDEFWWRNPPLDVDVTNQGITATSRTLQVPTGLSVWAIVNLKFDTTGGGAVYIRPDSTDIDDEAVTTLGTAAPLAQIQADSSTGVGAQATVRTNTTSGITTRAATVDTTIRISTLAYIDRRGRDN